jgi:hypothetical protein
MAANYSFTSLYDKVLLWLHGRRLGVLGDAYGSNTSLLVLDGVAVGSSRSGASAIKAIAAMLAGAGSVTVANVAVGDLVELVVDLTGLADVSGSFETTVSVAGHVQQTGAGTAGHVLLFFVKPQV